MLTFSSIFDDFVETQGMKKGECVSDYEAKKNVATIDISQLDYPVEYYKSETIGEKKY